MRPTRTASVPAKAVARARRGRRHRVCSRARVAAASPLWRSGRSGGSRACARIAIRRACARLTVVSFTAFALAQLPAPPRRVLEVGCGREGGVAPDLAAAGHDVIAIDPDAPDGPFYRQTTLEEFDDTQAFDAVVAGRVLHHVQPLAPALDKLVRFAPLLILDEFAWNHMDPATVDWYERQHRALVAAGTEPKGPPDLS